jgi:predicted membrane-bound spermidine synthase
MRSQTSGWIILVLFFLSGATALVYEVVWSKFLSQMFGSTIYAQTVVLAVFMGGLALGNRLFGKWSDGLRRPVGAYGFLEIAIGVYALLFPLLDRTVNRVFEAVGTPIAAHPGLLLALKGTLAALLLLGPTILMGGTLPLLAAWLQRFFADAGRHSARFYSVNSLGAVTGAALAGFLLVQQFGMVGTLRISASVNVIIGSLAVLLSQKWPLAEGVTESPAHPETTPSFASMTLLGAGLIVAITGGISMGLEVLASRSLALIFGSSLQSFAIVLVAFILGIGLGSAWIASPGRTGKGVDRIAILLLCGAAVWVTILVFKIESWVDLYRIVRVGLARNDVGYTYQLISSGLIALVVLGIPAACIGAVLPLMIRAVSTESGLLGAKVGKLLTWNTIGCVMGTLLTGFVLMPLVSLRNAFGALALALGLVSLALAARSRWYVGAATATVASVFAVSLFIFGAEGWQNVMSSGVFRLNEAKFEPQFMAWRKEHTKPRFYEDSPDATVIVEETDSPTTPTALGLRINGKPDASTGMDLDTQFLLAHLPMLAKPGAQDVFVLGLGSGVTAGATLDYPIKQVVVAENCPPVIEAAELFREWNRNVLHDPRAHVWSEDARTVLKLQPQQYDVLITEPSNAWTVGVGSVFSREFYELVSRRLKPGGIICQWFHVYEMNDETLTLVLRTFGSVFPYVEIWDIGTDIIFLGSQQPWQTGPEVFQKGFAIERVKTDMEMINIKSPEALMARQMASQRTGFAIAGDGPVQTDLSPILEYAAPKALFIAAGSRLLERYDERTRQQLLAPMEKRQTLSSLALDGLQYLFSGDFGTGNGELYGCLWGNAAAANIPCIFHTEQSRPDTIGDNPALAGALEAFAAGRIPDAEQIVRAALTRNPSDEQALYLERVFEREKQSHNGNAALVNVR